MMKQRERFILWMVFGAFLWSPAHSYAQAMLMPADTVIMQEETVEPSSDISPPQETTQVEFTQEDLKAVKALSLQLQKIRASQANSEQREQEVNIFLRMTKLLFLSIMDGVTTTAKQIGKSLVSPQFWLDLIKLSPVIIVLILGIMYREPIIKGGKAAYAGYKKLERAVESLEKKVEEVEQMVERAPEVIKERAAEAAQQAQEVMVEIASDVAESAAQVPTLVTEELQRELQELQIPFEQLSERDKFRRIERLKLLYQAGKIGDRQLHALGLEGKRDPQTGITTITQKRPERPPVVKKKRKFRGSLPAHVETVIEAREQEAEMGPLPATAEIMPVLGTLKEAVQPRVEPEVPKPTKVFIEPEKPFEIRGALGGVGRSKESPSKKIDISTFFN